MAYGTIFHQCVYLLARKDDATMQVSEGHCTKGSQDGKGPARPPVFVASSQHRLALASQAGARARAAYGQDVQAPYMPHLSLLYSDMPQEERAAVAAEAQQRVLEGGGGAAAGVDIGSVAVWYTPVEDKSLGSWRLVRELPLYGALK